jgi:hypothetical protein
LGAIFLLLEDGVGNLEVTMSWAMEACRIPSMGKHLCWAFADWAYGLRLRHQTFPKLALYPRLEA